MDGASIASLATPGLGLGVLMGQRTDPQPRGFFLPFRLPGDTPGAHQLSSGGSFLLAVRVSSTLSL